MATEVLGVAEAQIRFAVLALAPEMLFSLPAFFGDALLDNQVDLITTWANR